MIQFDTRPIDIQLSLPIRWNAYVWVFLVWLQDSWLTGMKIMTLFLRKMLGTRYGSVGPRFFILGTRFTFNSRDPNQVLKTP